MNFLLRKKLRMRKEQEQEQELVRDFSEVSWWTKLWCRHTLNGRLIKSGFVTASDDLACYFWSERGQVIECPKCGKHVTWSLRRETGRWQVVN